MKHSDNITFEKYARKSSYKAGKQSSAHKEKEHKQYWRQERKNVRESKRYMGEFV